MRILVTGASGFIGSRLCARLSGGHEVVPLDLGPGGRQPSADELSSGVRGSDAVVHLAGVKGEDCARDPFRALDTNLLLTRQLLAECRRSGTPRFLFASTYFVYGRHDDADLPCAEDAALRPEDAYSLTKALGEMLVRSSAVPHTIVRLSNVFAFDPHGRGRDAVHAFTRSALGDGIVRVFGQGDHSVDFLPAEEACRALEGLLASPKAAGETVNVASGAPMPLKLLAALVADAVARETGKRVVVEHAAAESGPPPVSRSVSIQKLRDLLAPERFPSVTLAEAVEAYVRDFRSQP